METVGRTLKNGRILHGSVSQSVGWLVVFEVGLLIQLYPGLPSLSIGRLGRSWQTKRGFTEEQGSVEFILQSQLKDSLKWSRIPIYVEGGMSQI